MPPSVSPATALRWTELLIESDRRYFEAGTTAHRVAGGRLAVLEGLAHLSAGAVLLVDRPRAIVERPAAWRDAARAVCAEAGAAELRFYTPAGDALLTNALATTGIVPAPEIAMAGFARRLALGRATVGDDATWSIREVASEELWSVKASLHARTPERPDGKASDAASWVKLERAKAAAGYMTPYLIERDGEACGAFGLSFTPQMLRFKNYFLVPEHRARGGGSSVLRLIARAALARGIEAVGCFVLPGSDGERLYARNGFVSVGRQLEWITPAAANARAERRATRNAVG